MLIIIDEPGNENPILRFGSATAGPVFKKIVKELIVLPNSNLLDDMDGIKNNYVIVPECIGSALEQGKNKLKKKNLNWKILGNGTKIIDQFPKPGFSIQENSSIRLVTTR